jgi:hypothetical protein
MQANPSPMNPMALQSIANFFDAVSELRRLGVIRSDKYLGDLAEYICSHFFDIELAASGRQPGYDGIANNARFQIKYHGSSTRTNIDLGDPTQYDTLLVVLGPASMLRAPAYTDDFLVYRMPSESVKSHVRKDQVTYSCGKTPFARVPDKAFSIRAQLNAMVADAPAG